MKPAKSAWRIEIQTRLTAPNGRNRLGPPRGFGQKLPKSGRFTTQGSRRAGPTATIRWQSPLALEERSGLAKRSRSARLPSRRRRRPPEPSRQRKAREPTG